MPISSLEIANMNGAFVQQGMMLQQNASMIGAIGAPQLGGGSGQTFGEHVAGRAANIGTAVGGPGMSLMAGMAGLDPMSMAFKGASLGYKAGGFAGAAAGGMALGGAASVGAMGVNYAVNQMMTGIQQQQQLTQMLGQSFKFQNQFGGTGFTGGQSRTIGNDLAGMQGFSGPGQTGHMMGFEELSRLAAGMGAMGMGQGVKTVQDFSKRFKEMLTAVKDISSTMQTSLEEAQKMMGDMRSSGVFGAGNATRVAQQVRATAVAGGIATTEVTAMMGIGSQMARMTGGLGRQGVNAGIRAIGQVRAAVQVGALSEEDIYNTTGLTGAEGRQAFAVRGMQQSDAFLRQNRGRIFMASMAMKGGKVDENSVLDYLSGGMSPEESKARADKNLAKIGRADFIRNEGRMRAAVTERLGTLAPVVAMKGWLESRGVSMDDDRAMLYLQRAQGMGRDEADAMLQTMRSLPQILEQQKNSARQDQRSQRMAESRSRVGPEKWKRQFEDVRSKIQTQLQEVGRDAMSAGTDMIDEFMGKLSGDMVSVQYNNIDKLREAAKGLGRSGQLARDTLGGKIGQSAEFSSAAAKGAAGMGFGASGADVSTFNRIDRERYDAAGFKVGRVGSTAELQKKLDRFTAMGEGARAGIAAGPSEFGKSHADALLDYAAQHGTGKGAGVIGSYHGFLEEKALNGDGSAKAELDKFRSADPAEKAKMAASSFIAGELNVAEQMQPPGASGITSMRAGVNSLSESHKLIGSKFTGKEGFGKEALTAMGWGSALAGAAIGGKLGIAGGSFLGPIGTALGGLSGAALGFAAGGVAGLWVASAQNKKNKAVGDYVDSEKFQDLGDRVFSGDKDTRSKALREVDKRLAQLQRGPDDAPRSDAEEAENIGMSGLKLGNAIDSAMAKEGVSDPDKLSAEAKKAIGDMGKAFGAGGWESASKRGLAAASVTSGKAKERYEQHKSELAEDAKGTLGNLEDSGAFEKGQGGKLQVSTDALLALGNNTGNTRELMEKVAQQQEAAASGNMDEYNRLTKEIGEGKEGMSAADKKKVEQAMGGTAFGRELATERKTGEKLARGFASGGVAGGVKMGLEVAGVRGIGSRDLKRMMAGGDKGMKELLATAESEGGVTSEEARNALKAGLTAMQKGNTSEAQKAFSNKALQQETSTANQKKSMDKANADNPVGAKTNEHLAKMNSTMDKLADYAKATVSANEKAAAALSDIEANRKNEATG